MATSAALPTLVFLDTLMQQTLIILKPSTVQRGLVGEVIDRFQKKGLIIAGIKMMQLGDEILREHYAHLVDKPFFPSLLKSMQAIISKTCSIFYTIDSKNTTLMVELVIPIFIIALTHNHSPRK